METRKERGSQGMRETGIGGEQGNNETRRTRGTRGTRNDEEKMASREGGSSEEGIKGREMKIIGNQGKGG